VDGLAEYYTGSVEVLSKISYLLVWIFKYINREHFCDFSALYNCELHTGVGLLFYCHIVS